MPLKYTEKEKPGNHHGSKKDASPRVHPHRDTVSENVNINSHNLQETKRENEDNKIKMFTLS
jgi:hypothetical protein